MPLLISRPSCIWIITKGAEALLIRACALETKRSVGGAACMFSPASSRTCAKQHCGLFLFTVMHMQDSVRHFRFCGMHCDGAVVSDGDDCECCSGCSGCGCSGGGGGGGLGSYVIFNVSKLLMLAFHKDSTRLWIANRKRRRHQY